MALQGQGLAGGGGVGPRLEVAEVFADELLGLRDVDVPDDVEVGVVRPVVRAVEGLCLCFVWGCMCVREVSVL